MPDASGVEVGNDLADVIRAEQLAAVGDTCKSGVARNAEGRGELRSVSSSFVV